MKYECIFAEDKNIGMVLLPTVCCICANLENMADLAHILWPNLEPSNASAKILYLNQMSNNKKAYNIHQLAGKHHTKCSPLLKHMQQLQIYWKIINLSKYSKYVEVLLINMSHFSMFISSIFAVITKEHIHSSSQSSRPHQVHSKASSKLPRS